MVVQLTILASYVKKYAAKDKRVKYICQENEGISSVRDTSLRATSGDYILMVDGDDALHPQLFDESIRLKNNIIS